MLCLPPLTSVRRRAYVCPVLSGKFPYYTVEPPTTSIHQTPGTPSLLRAINERTVLELIRVEGALSRAQVARQSGLSKPTVSQALAGLEESGLVREVGRSTGRKGPGALLYELNPRSGLVVGLDVGRNWVRGAIADIAGHVVCRRQERTARTAAALVEQVAGLGRLLAGDADLKWRAVTHTTVGIPGALDPVLGTVELAPNLPRWTSRGLLEAIRHQLGDAVSFENDVNLAALGEQSAGCAVGVQNFVFLSVGTGVGLGIVIEGRLYRGARGAAGEIGYMPLGAGDPHDRATRRRGALEEATSASGVVSLARELGMPPPLTPKRVFDAARRNDPLAARVVQAEANRIAMAIAAVAPVLDPELVILGGGIGGGGGDLLVDRTLAELTDLSPFRPRIEVSVLGDEVVLQGALSTALAVAREQVFNRSPDQERREIMV